MNFRSLVTPVFTAVAASVAAFVLLVIFAASEQDQLSLEIEQKVVQQKISVYAQNLRSFADDNAWWDTAVKKVMLSEDMAWMDNTLGSTVRNIESVDGIFVLRPDQSMIYATHVATGGARANLEVLLAAGLSDVISGLDITASEDAHAAAGLLKGADGQIVAYGASLLRANDNITFSPPLAVTRPVIIFYALLSDRDIEQIGFANAIDHLHYASRKPDHPAHMALESFNGDSIGWLTWEPRDPGTEMALDMVVPAVILLAFVVFAMIRFTRQATRLVGGLEQANKSKSSFLASMSHEVRTPLNSILGFTELMSMELFGKVEGKKNKEYLGLIKNSGEHLLAIINDILDISKLEAGKFDVYAEKIAPAVIVQECAKMVEINALDRGVELTYECEPVTLHSDERIMRQILLNILSNAVKFTKKGGSVHVSGQCGQNHYQIDVADNGIGMSAEGIEIALSTFGQVQNEYAKSHGGTGLGLPLVKRFMTLLDGDIGIASNPGKGTTVTLIFPYRTQAKKL